MYSVEHSEKEINGIKWRTIDDNGLGIESTFYYIVLNDYLYYIELNGIDKYPDEFNKFMNNVSIN